MIDAQTVLVLGAGPSKAVGLPTTEGKIYANIR